ncbi:hypothetical protein F442_03552 [Phytophthora nicotianae P10297]|uniref:RxLR effector protein n=3 Tax=Phytophthora nicotianae TaxID=4792 RepID=W2QMD3_PHYN3|nr:hypothetical protein PPTG_08427 [Phytophthora nicotianae INRA-310]ETM53069.1 hypothetical protein L914_03438 [Phytophthora nicotianae]ETN13679.1 hypothetical protein PPTG_08427 [Phytophthora nicotianae INRA-310]ETP51304.1 hypothetical protein F442_03552 [Phytophthora nicotianae P10297]KUF78639.1 hypothetical protein AM587_10014898 [Phytophthora nicotianae]
MRAYFILLLAVATLLVSTNTASGSAIKLRSTHAEVETDSGRVLLANSKTSTDDEERAALDVIKKVGNWVRNKKLLANLKMQASYVYSEKITREIMGKGIDPDMLFALLKLGTKNKRWSARSGNKPRYTLWMNYKEGYEALNSNWKSKLPPISDL